MDTFKPIRILRNKHFQSIAASVKLRRPIVRRRAAGMLNASEEVIIECSDGVRLQGYLSQHEGGSRDLAILLHGWEGSSDSMYLLSSAGTLFNKGMNVFRLNMRDHGTSHHLNRELFHSCRLDEIVDAVKQVCETYGVSGRKVFLCGFSLGGNFSLRVAVKAPEVNLHIDKVIAVCPVLRPPSTLDALEKGPFVYRKYFIRKWKRSLLKKQRLFPDAYDFNNSAHFRSLTAMTDYFVDLYTEYPDLRTYLNGYDITGDVLKDLTIPSHIIASRDDPVIPYRDMKHLAASVNLTITSTRYGGHCGFISGLKMKSWVDEMLPELIAAGWPATN